VSPIVKIELRDTQYPELLSKIYDPPKELFIDGDPSILNSKCLAIVGTRTPTMYGKEISRKFAYELAQAGFTIVSGLAEGIDTEAHIGALEAKGRTIAVFGCGIDMIFPASNISLSENISNNGALISEYAPGVPPAKWTFPRRNRIIAGLSKGVIVVEGHYDSGAMITAKAALDEGREVFAVPGNIGLEQSKGPHWLIKQGAKLVESVEDVLEEFGMQKDSAKKVQIDHAQLTLEESALIKALLIEPMHIDGLARKVGVASHDALSVLSVMELKGLVKQMPGKYFSIY
jgi:DNA processing protein